MLSTKPKAALQLLYDIIKNLGIISYQITFYYSMKTKEKLEIKMPSNSSQMVAITGTTSKCQKAGGLYKYERKSLN